MLNPPLAHLVAPLILCGALLLTAGTAAGCGWWGDSEAERDDTIVVLPGGADRAERDLSDPATMARLALAYRQGDGVPRDLALARSWAERAARAGHAGAMNDLGQMLETGIGGPVDPEAAAVWYREAALLGIANAQHSLAMMLEAGRGLPRDIAASELWLRRSASQGHATAAADLADRIWAGSVVQRHPSEGCLWWLIALAQGFAGTVDKCFEAEPTLSEQAFGQLQGQAAAWSVRHQENPVSSGGDS